MKIASHFVPLEPFIDHGLIAGAVALAATKDEIIGLEAVGYADLETKRPMTTDSLFWVASMTKPMTATALMMLVDEGEVNVNDPVEKYLPEFKGQMFIAEKDDDHVLLKKPQHPIRVSEVLNHTSGLPFSVPIETPTFDMFRLRDAVHAYAATPLLFEPGTKYQYSNAGTNTCGRIIEVVSGMPYEEFMDRRLFDPLGMKQTTFWPSDRQIRRLASIYRVKDDKSGLEEAPLGQLSVPYSDPNRKPLPAGGLFSIAEDCARFCQMILSGGTFEGRKYLSEAAIKQMTSRQTPEGIETSYGFGWGVDKETFGHGGAYKTNMTINPKLGLITVFLIHHASEWPSDEGKAIHPLVLAAAEKLL